MPRMTGSRAAEFTAPLDALGTVVSLAGGVTDIHIDNVVTTLDGTTEELKRIRRIGELTLGQEVEVDEGD